MNFPKDNKQLDQIFIDGSEPLIEEFVDEYWVKMLTGVIPNFRWAGRFVLIAAVCFVTIRPYYHKSSVLTETKK